MNQDIVYRERISSTRTEVLFLVLTVIFLSLLAWRLASGSLDVLTVAFGALFIFFLFYTVNYRTLEIWITSKELNLSFGIFTWNVPLDNVAACCLDEAPPFMRMGGAGIHFMFINQRYRASFNFLEYPRVLIAFKRKVGPVHDLSFSTRRPEEVLRVIKEAGAVIGST
jgi:Ca2+/Na+ antiporter